MIGDRVGADAPIQTALDNPWHFGVSHPELKCEPPFYSEAYNTAHPGQIRRIGGFLSDFEACHDLGRNRNRAYSLRAVVTLRPKAGFDALDRGLPVKCKAMFDDEAGPA